MNNPYDENNQQMGYGQEPLTGGPVVYPEPPAEHIYQGSPGFASASLSMGILSLVSMCCFPPLALLFGGLGILFGVISKGTYARPGNAKAGMALSSAGIAIVAAIILFFVVHHAFHCGRAHFCQPVSAYTDSSGAVYRG